MNSLFYQQLEQYLNQQQLGFILYHDYRITQNYACLHKGNNNDTKIYITQEPSIANIDQYSVDFFNHKDSDDYREVILCLRGFLNRYHHSKGNGYIIYRKSSEMDSEFELHVDIDPFYQIFSDTHTRLENRSPIWALINKKNLDWFLYFHPMCFDTLQAIVNFVHPILNKENQYLIKKYMKFINTDTFEKGILLKLNRHQYELLFPESSHLTFELRIKHLPRSVPLIFSDIGEKSIIERIEEIEEMNKLVRLFSP